MKAKELDDSQEDIKKLYNALKKNNKREATLIFTHLIKFHKLTRKYVEESIKVIGAGKMAAVTETEKAK